MAGAWRRVLPYPQIPRGPGAYAGPPDLVQMGELLDMALRGGALDGGLLGGGRDLPYRARKRAGHRAGNRDLRCVVGRWLGDLLPALQIGVGGTTDRFDAGP